MVNHDSKPRFYKKSDDHPEMGSAIPDQCQNRAFYCFLIAFSTCENIKQLKINVLIQMSAKVENRVFKYSGLFFYCYLLYSLSMLAANN